MSFSVFRADPWHSDYLMNERVPRWWLLSPLLLSPYLPLKVLLTGHLLAALALVLGDGDARFFDVASGPTWLTWWPVRGFKEGRFSQGALRCQRQKDGNKNQILKISPNFQGVFKVWQWEINSRKPCGHDKLSLYRYI